MRDKVKRGGSERGRRRERKEWGREREGEEVRGRREEETPGSTEAFPQAFG